MISKLLAYVCEHFWCFFSLSFTIVFLIIYSSVGKCCKKDCDYILESAAELIGRSGGVQDVLAALRLFPNDAELATSACGAVWSLTVNGTSIFVVLAG